VIADPPSERRLVAVRKLISALTTVPDGPRFPIRRRIREAPQVAAAQAAACALSAASDAICENATPHWGDTEDGAQRRPRSGAR
jgi:hypothetical protein